jgi:tRNA (guanine-N7-)-methyltransferase
MKPGGVWRLATDCADYADRMREVLDNDHDFTNEHPSGWAPRWEARPITQFEQRGLDAGRRTFDLAYRCVS